MEEGSRRWMRGHGGEEGLVNTGGRRGNLKLEIYLKKISPPAQSEGGGRMNGGGA